MKNYILLMDIEKNLKKESRIYLTWILKILKCNDKEEALKLIKEDNLSFEKFGRYITLFERKYGYATEEIKWLKQIYNIYYNSCKNNVINIEKSKNQESNNNLINLLKSDLCAEEYSFKYGLNLHVLSRSIRNRKDNLEILNKLNKRDKTNFYRLFDQLLLAVQDEDFDVIDYLLMTKMPFEDAIKLADKRIVNRKILNDVRHKIGKFKTISQINMNKDMAMNEKLIIKNVEITDEMKEEAFNYIEENNLPNYVYRTYIRRILKNKVKVK